MSCRRRPASRFACALLFALLGCGGSQKIPRPYPAPTAADVTAHLRGVQRAARSFFAISKMEYWRDGQRIKPTVYLMGEPGSRARFNALNPTGGDVAADLACNGADFAFVDYNKNCQLRGPCTRDAVARLLQVSLAPDDFLLLAVGSAPLIGGRASLAWDPKRGAEVLTVVDTDGWREILVLDGRERRWDVLEASLTRPDGELEWTLTNKEFSPLRAADGTDFRVPGKTRFEQAQSGADLVVRWLERTLNEPLAPEKFEMEIPAGLPPCAEKTAN